MLAAGARSIDNISGESCDESWSGGHFYSNKAPGLALVSLPWYEALRAVGALRRDPVAHAHFPTAMRAIPRRDLWLMGLWGAVLPALGALLLVRSLADRLESGSGTLAAATLGFATLLLPFGSLYFSHALAAFLALAAFSLVVRKRLPLVSGMIVGFGIVVEYPLALLAIVLTGAVLGRDGWRSAARLAAGVVVGVAPLFVFDTWVFETPFHLSYVGAILVPGVSGHDVLGANHSGFFGVGWPRPSAALQVLAGPRGLLSVAPVLLLVPVGIRMLWRSGRRWEAALAGTICGTFLLYNFGYYSPLGGATPGPRLLVCVLGIAVVALAPVFRVASFTWCALLLASAVSLLAAHLTQPLISRPFDTGNWWEWLRGEHFTATIVSPALHSWLGAAPIALAALGGIAVAGGTLTPAGRRDAEAALIAVALWASCLLVAPAEFRSYAAAVSSVVALIFLRGSAPGRSARRLLENATAAVLVLSPLGRILWLIAVGLLIDLAVRLT